MALFKTAPTINFSTNTVLFIAFAFLAFASCSKDTEIEIPVPVNDFVEIPDIETDDFRRLCCDVNNCSEDHFERILVDPARDELIEDFRVSRLEVMREVVEGTLDTLAICCFSEEPDNLLMWSHYGSALKGVVLGFSPRGIFPSLPEGALLSVDYPQDLKYPSFDFTKYVLAVGTESYSEVEREMWTKVFATKSLSWQYEKEWRYVGETKEPKLGYGEGALKEVIFGEFLDSGLEKDIRSVLEGQGVTFKRAIRDQDFYRVNVVEA